MAGIHDNFRTFLVSSNFSVKRSHFLFIQQCKSADSFFYLHNTLTHGSQMSDSLV